MKERLDAKNRLENYLISMCRAFDGQRMDDEEKQRILEAVKDAFHWLDPNPLAEAEEIEEICAPILSKYFAGQQDDVDDESDEMIHDEL